MFLILVLLLVIFLLFRVSRTARTGRRESSKPVQIFSEPYELQGRTPIGAVFPPTAGPLHANLEPPSSSRGVLLFADEPFLQRA